MIGLFLDTSSNYFMTAIVKNGEVIDSFSKEYQKDLSKEALYQIRNLLDKNSITLDMVDEIICTRGPGSFTGLRIGVTIAKTLAYFLNKDLYSVSTLDLLASSCKNSIIVPIINARRGYVYASIYDENYNILMDECYIKIDNLKEITLSFTSNPCYVSLDEFDFETIKYVPDLDNFFKHNFKRKENSMTFVPTYLKRVEAEEKLDDNRDK